MSDYTQLSFVNGKVFRHTVTNDPYQWEPEWVAHAKRHNTHECWIAHVGKCAYQARCSCGLRFGIHRYPLGQLGAQMDAANHRMNYGVSSYMMNDMEGIDRKLGGLAWE